MGLFSALRAIDNPTYQVKPQKAAKAAKVARRGGNAIVATTSAPRPGRASRSRGGSR
jgi:hypothetical protein